MNSAYRDFPAVHRLLAEPGVAAFNPSLGATMVKGAVVDVLREARAGVTNGAPAAPDYSELLARIAERLLRHEADGLLPVINATGVLLHTNLGRAPLAAEALAAMSEIAGGYSNLEFDLGEGARGSRYDRVTALLRETTGAQDALVVNNCAAAVFLILDTLAKGREAIVSRNQLIEIGGGFRLPDVITRSGARLVEVGTTNRVYLHDFERALTPATALLMRSHLSNFRMTGFVADVAPADLAALGRRTGIPTVEDLGTGALIDIAAYGLPHERTAREAVADGIDLVAFSGDKLLGGPQAGIIVGRRDALEPLRANPLLRALRVDKATLAALAATLRLYVTPGGISRIPLYAMLAQSPDALRERADRVRQALPVTVAARTATVDLAGYVGGGTLPDVAVPSAGLAVAPAAGDAGALAARVRRNRPAVVARVADGRLVLDLRTVVPALDPRLGTTLAAAFGDDA